MILSKDDILEIEARNVRRKQLRANVSKGSWTYDSFAFTEADSGPTNHRSCILVRRRNWFDKILSKHGSDFLDESVMDGPKQYIYKPAYDGLYIEAALNDTVESDIDRLLCELRRLRSDIPPLPEPPKHLRRVRRKHKAGRALPDGSRKGDTPLYDTEWEFREWFEDNLDRFGFSKIVLSQEVCPDYVVQTTDGLTLRIEAELFAANFVAHGHNPTKVDRIVA